MSELAFAPLATFADIAMGQSPGAETCNNDGKGLPFLQGCAEFGQRSPTTEVFCSPPLRVGKANSVLISVRAPVGTMNYADQDYCIGRGLAAFKAKPDSADIIFLKHAVELNSGFLHRRSQGSTFAAVSSADVRNVPVPNIPYAKQKKIAAILTSIDTAIEKTEALIEKYQQIEAGLMHDLFTRGVLPNGQLRPPRDQAPALYQETAIGWIPADWRVENLGRMAKIVSGINYRRYEAACKAGQVRTGQMFVTDVNELMGPRWIVNFPTKQHWRAPSRMEWIVDGLRDLRRFIVDKHVGSIALPALGAGNGGLDWPAVREQIERALGDLDADVSVFEPIAASLSILQKPVYHQADSNRGGS